MKTRLTLCLLALLLLCLSLGAAAQIPENLLAHIYLSNNRDAILENHRSFMYTETGAQAHTYYADADVTVLDYLESRGHMRVRTDAFDYLLFTDGRFSRYVSFETDSGDWEGLVDGMLYETVLSVEERDGLLTVTTEPSEASRQDILDSAYPDVADRDRIQLREVYVLSADTLELQSLSNNDIMPDGSEVCAWEMRLSYDVDLPCADEVEAIRQHLASADGQRTTRFVFDAGTAYECTLECPTPIGDNCAIPQDLTKDGVEYQIDPDRSIPTNEARDNDAVIYLDRVDED